MAVARLLRCAGSPEPSLVAYVKSTILQNFFPNSKLDWSYHAQQVLAFLFWVYLPNNRAAKHNATGQKLPEINTVWCCTGKDLMFFACCVYWICKQYWPSYYFDARVLLSTSKIADNKPVTNCQEPCVSYHDNPKSLDRQVLANNVDLVTP